MTYIPLPCAERGQFLALEFSGNEIKVAFVKLKNNSFDMRAKQYTISEDLRKGNGTELFDFFALKIQDFCDTQKLWGTSLMLGFSLGFPYEQKSIKSGILLNWTKEFSCSGVVGKDVVVLLEQALSKIKVLDVKVMAIINNATGSLLSCAWKNRMCRVGCRFGFGTNISYVEKVKHVPKYLGDATDIIVINTECGNFGAGNKIGFLRTGWDRELDNDSSNPGSQLLEKMTALMYLSEIVRRILVTAVQRNIILHAKMSRVLATIDSLHPKTIFDIIQDTVGQHGARVALNEMGYQTPCAQDCVDLEFVCSAVITRATVLMTAIFTALANHLRYKEVVLGIDGTFFHWMPNAADQIKEKVAELNPNIKFSYTLADDRGGLGAGLAACMAFDRLTRKSLDEIAAKEDSFFQTRTFVSVESLRTNGSKQSIGKSRLGNLDGSEHEKSSPKQSVRGSTPSNSRDKSIDKSRISGGELKVIKAPVRGGFRVSSPSTTIPQGLKQLQTGKRSSPSQILDKMNPSGMIKGQSLSRKNNSIASTSKSTSVSNFPKSSQAAGKQRPSVTKKTPGSPRNQTESSSKGSQRSTVSLGVAGTKADTRHSVREPSKISLSHAGKTHSSPNIPATKSGKQDTTKQITSTAKKYSDITRTSTSSRGSTNFKISNSSTISLAKMYSCSPSVSHTSSVKVKKETQSGGSKFNVVHSGKTPSATDLPKSEQQSGKQDTSKSEQPSAKKSVDSKNTEGPGVPNVSKKYVGTAATSDSSKHQATSAGKDKIPRTPPAEKDKHPIQSTEKKTEAGTKKNTGPAKPNSGN